MSFSDYPLCYLAMSDDNQQIVRQLSQQMEANSRHIEEIAEHQASPQAECQASPQLYRLTDIVNEDSESSTSNAIMHTLKFKPIHPDTFTANKNDDVDSWLFSMKQYADLVHILGQEIIQFAATLL